MNPYSGVPTWRFLGRLGWPLFAVWLLAFPLVGIVAQLPDLQNLEKNAANLVPAMQIADGGFYHASSQYILNTLSLWRAQPEVCREGSAKSDFLRQQCRALQGRAWAAFGVCLLPWVVGALFAFLMLDQLKNFYRRARKKIATDKSYSLGTVTQPARLPNHQFAWFFCLQRISVHLSEGQQVAVHLPLDAPTPLPGEKLLIHNLGAWFGRKRLVGALYAPHMAVLSGVKK